ncbi:phosphoribosylglycinamide formyltransferase [[Clostridium] ultunense Esp]|uniref:phosphoribosylglycinamide formyltransferase n=1 Tax=Thermicanus aegyptius TaxID=94009 RepID=UPI0002B70DB3|nr:phosphoribosylglycinamide formyltransferase [Thermicanus aegyptius]CCQ93117.1 phosphoribosylglycinamide formyltransferase [[Clostridium] ultunense Esp]
MRTPIAVFASGTGSNFQALVEHMENRETSYRIVLLVCDRPDAPVLQKAEQFGIKALALRPKDYPTKEAYEEEILGQLKTLGVKWIILAGYMRLIGRTLLQSYPQRIVNLHPSLLPAFPGKDAIAQAFRYGVKVTGVTVHLVDEGLDSGPILAQKAVSIQEGESLGRITEKIHHTEHLLYPMVVDRLVREGIIVEGRKVTWLGSASQADMGNMPEFQ